MFGQVLTILVVAFAIVGPAFAKSKDQYYLVRQDTRECAFPMCGGFFLKPVNSENLECPQSAVSRKYECYVVEISGVQITPSLGLVRGRFTTYNDELSSFTAVEGYDAAVTQSPRNTDPFLAVNDVGVSCALTPCNTFHGVKLNEPSYVKDLIMFAELDFGKLGKIEDTVRNEMRSNDVIVSASAYSVTGPGGNSQGLLISNVFTKQAEPKVACKNNRDCQKGDFCSKESCDSVSGVCQVRPQSCTKNLAPVCACDGVRQYDNDCIRQLFGVSAATDGSCSPTQ